MPVIHTHVSVKTTPEQREALKAAYGKAITAVPGKSEGWLMCPFEDDMPIYFGGSVGEADQVDHGRAQQRARHPRGPHLHPLHRHHRLGLERR